MASRAPKLRARFEGVRLLHHHARPARDLTVFRGSLAHASAAATPTEGEGTTVGVVRLHPAADSPEPLDDPRTPCNPLPWLRGALQTSWVSGGSKISGGIHGDLTRHPQGFAGGFKTSRASGGNAFGELRLPLPPSPASPAIPRPGSPFRRNVRQHPVGGQALWVHTSVNTPLPVAGLQGSKGAAPGSGVVAGNPPPGPWRERIYAKGLNEYNWVLRGLLDDRQFVLSRGGLRAFLMREVYNDMLMDGVAPNKLTWHSLVVSSMRSRRVQDAFFFFDQMKEFGFKPDAVLYNCLINVCAATGHVDRAFQVAAEMEGSGVKPLHRTFTALLNACGGTGRVQDALGVVQRMKTEKRRLDKFCYAALINAYKTARPVTPEAKSMVFELLEQARKARLSAEEASAKSPQEASEDDKPGGPGGALGDEAEGATLSSTSLGNEMIAEERRTLGLQGQMAGDQVAYHAAMRAMVEWRDVKGASRVMEMIAEDGVKPDPSITVGLIELHILTGKLDIVEDLINDLTGRGFKPSVKLQVAIMGASVSLGTKEGLNLANKLMGAFITRGLFLHTQHTGYLLNLACRHEDFSFAETVFDHVLNCSRLPLSIPPHRQGIASFIVALQRRGIDNERLAQAQELMQKLLPYSGRSAQQEGLPSQPASGEGGEPEQVSEELA